MLVAIHVAPHERHDAIKAYARFLTPEQVSEIEEAEEGRWIKLEMGGGPTVVIIEATPCP